VVAKDISYGFLLVNYGNKEELRVPRLDDYPDYRKIEGCINDNFSSYF
jgi:hypothetical protein